MFDHADNRYSRFVALAKVILPLIALALLSTIFLVARTPNTSGTIPYAEGTIEDLARKPRLTAPTYTGVATDGSRIEVSAASAEPTDDGALVTTPMARIEQPSGTVIELSAGLGELLNGTDILRFDGLARIQTSSGYAMETTGADAELATGRVVSHGRVEVRTPEGQLTAGLVTLEPRSETSAPQLVFSGGVTLIYNPDIEGRRP